MILLPQPLESYTGLHDYSQLFNMKLIHHCSFLFKVALIINIEYILEEKSIANYFYPESSDKQSDGSL
jgi:hypothetical protein